MMYLKLRIHDAAGCTADWTKLFKYSFDQTRHIVCCLLWHSDVINVLAGLFKRCLARLICIVHPTGCTMQPVV